MFEELCRKQGTLLIPTGEYEDSLPEYEEIPVKYFSMDKTSRKTDGAQQVNTQYYCKGYGKAAPASTILRLEDGSVEMVQSRITALESCRVTEDDYWTAGIEFLKKTAFSCPDHRKGT